jgi:hypothetical protein
MAAGRNFSRHYALLGEYSFYHFSLPPIPVAETVTPYPPSDGAEDVGNTHIWSLTAEGKYQYAATETVGAYLLAGGGAYHRNFDCGSAPCGDSFYGGANAGTGIAYKLSENANVKVFAELRYIWIDTSSQVLVTMQTSGKRTMFVPATVGFRW